MAYILRSIAVIGVIALNSPVHGSKTDDEARAPAIREAMAAALPVELRNTAGNASGALTAAREAAQILAGLDPETRERVLNLAASAATGRSPSR